MKMYTAQEMRVRSDYLEGALADAKTAAMLRQAANMMEREEKREKKYEYAAHYYRNGCMVGKSMERWETLQEAKWANLYCRGGETIVFARREVGEWEEVDG